MNAEIISIGTELLLGEIVDTNSAYIAQKLRGIGLNLYFTTTVGDNEARIVQAIDTALQRADIIITTGGLGPTVDDMTRQAVAQATGRELVFQQFLLDQIAERFRGFGRPMSENNRRQAYLPADAIPIENPVGTAPCFIVESERGTVISLPGVPSEMKYLLENAVLPYLKEKYSLTGIIKARVLRTAGIGESVVDEALGELMSLGNPTVGLAAHIGQTDIRITAKAPDETTADSLIASVEQTVRRRLGKYIYGTGQQAVEEALVAELVAQGVTVTVSETHTDRSLQKRLLAQPGGDRVLVAHAYYADTAALNEELGLADDVDPADRAERAAQQITVNGRLSIGIALVLQSEGVSIAVATPDGIEKRFYDFISERGIDAAQWAGTWGIAHAWHWLRRQQ